MFRTSAVPTLSTRGGRLAVLLVMCSLLLSMAACGGGDDAAADGKVHLRFSWWGSDERHAMTQELIDKFEESHPDIKIDGEEYLILREDEVLAVIG